MKSIKLFPAICCLLYIIPHTRVSVLTSLCGDAGAVRQRHGRRAVRRPPRAGGGRASLAALGRKPYNTLCNGLTALIYTFSYIHISILHH